MAENDAPANRGESLETPPAERAPAPEARAAAPRRIIGSARTATPPPPHPELEAKLASLIDSAQVFQREISGETAPAAADDGGKVRRLNRFQRTGGDEVAPAPDEAPLDHEVRGNDATLNENIAWPRISRPMEELPTMGERIGAFLRGHPEVIYVLMLAAGLGLMVFGYSSGEQDARSAAIAAAKKPDRSSALARFGVSERQLAATSEGMAAEQAGDVVKARDVYGRTEAVAAPLPGAEYRLAMLDLERSDDATAAKHLDLSLERGEKLAPAYFVKACLAGKQKNYLAAARELASAVRLDPFGAKYYFCWGEALRRAGQPRQALGPLRQALLRPRSQGDAELFEFKLRLARFESADDAGFDAEMTGQLGRPAVTGDWLLIAAARDLARSNWTEAANRLQSAAHALPPEVYRLWVQDYLFQSYAAQKDVADLLKVSTPPSSVGPFDPAIWPAEEADPAVWPPFAPVPALAPTQPPPPAL